MSDFFDIIKPIELNEIIDIFKKHIVKESKINNNNYIKFIDFRYPKYFVDKFGSKAITNKIYEFILMNTSRRHLERDFIEIKNDVDVENDESLINNIIFYKYVNKNGEDENKNEEDITKYIFSSNEEDITKYYISSNLKDINISGILFPVLNREQCSSVSDYIPVYKEIKKYHKNGQLEEEVTYIDNKMNGIYKSYHENGQLKEEVNYIDDKKEGIYKSYHKNGELYEEVNYIDNKMNGIYKSYHLENGQLKEEINYIDDKMNGIYKSYHENGQLKKEVNYINDKKNGIYKSYFVNGQLWEEVNYIDDKKEGIYKEYFENGQLIAEVNYINDIKVEN